jgi:hypothetical protein
MAIHSFVFSVSALVDKAFDGVKGGFENGVESGSGLCPGLAFRVTHGAESLPAGWTFENGVIGYAVGDDHGRATFRAIGRDGNFFGHGDPPGPEG